MKFKLKEGLLLGSATAATQIEGGDKTTTGRDSQVKLRYRTAQPPSARPTTI